jgi:HupE/UreJ protein
VGQVGAMGAMGDGSRQKHGRARPSGCARASLQPRAQSPRRGGPSLKIGSYQCFLGGLIALLVLWRGVGIAHDIPNDVTVQAFLKPEGQTLRLLVRVPLIAMRDMDYPKLGPGANSGLLDLSRAEGTLRDAATLWVADDVSVYEENVKLAYPRVIAVRAALPSDRSFSSYDEALAHVTGEPLPPNTEFLWSQGLLDVLFEYSIHSEQSRFSIEPKLARLGLRTVTVLRFLPPGGAVRAFEFQGDPGIVRLDPRWHQAAFQFVKLGFAHILDGIDHLLFLFCLVIPFRRLGSLVAVITSFTVAHSITLLASAYNLAPDALWFPPLIETLIATSIVYMALENIVIGVSSGAAAPGTPPPLRRRWLITFGFGLVHGFGFSFALKQTLQFAGSHLLTSLLSFNIGVELGQLVVLAVFVPGLALLFRYVVAERIGTIMLSALVTHTAWHWMTERVDVLRRFRFEWPTVDALFWVAVMRWAMIAVAACGLYWLVFVVLKSGRPAHDPASSQTSS